MAAPCLHLFGTPALETAKGREPFAVERPYQLLAYLACRGVWVARDVAATLFWPDRDTSTARANLRFVLVQIRRLAHVAGFEARADALRWAVASDVQRFERAVAEDDWATAISLHERPLLEGFEQNAPSPYIEWLEFERARLHALWRTALEARLAELGDDPAACAALAARGLQADPLDDTALTFRLKALCTLGHVDEARRAYRDYAHRLAADLAIEPSAAVRDLVRRLDPERPTALPPAAAEPVTVKPGLIGRRVEMGRLKQLMRADECRMLTINGPGGVGKSALARTALPALAEGFSDGAFWIALDDLRNIDDIVPRCATRLGFVLHGADAPLQQLQDQLRDRQVLLVFDNAEHLAGFGAWLDSLAGACDRLKVLVTSRMRLDLAEEYLLPLEGLPAPDTDETETDALRAFDAVKLFEERACRVHPEFDGRGSAADIAALVRAVDGLPLAIELAAAWVRLLPVAEIRRELEQSLDVLDSAAPGRGRGYSVRDSFEHSWRLLAPAEQGALARLAVFRGDFSRDSARAAADAALPLLAALADKSLLRTTELGRFGFHPLLRQFALEKLDRMGEDEQHIARTRHAEHYLGQLARYNAFHALDQRAAMQAIGAEFENMLAAWHFAVAQRRVDLLQGCASALESYLDSRGQQQFGLEVMTAAAGVIDATRPDHQLARCHVELARAAFCYRRGDYHTGETAARAALQAAKRIKYVFGVKSSTNTLGVMLWRLGHMKEAAFCLRDVLRRAHAEGDEAGAPLYAINLSRLEIELGNYDEGERLVHEALEGNRRNGNLVGIHAALNELCHQHLDRGRPEAVLPLAYEGLASCETSGIDRNSSYFHRCLADAYFALDDLSASADHAQQALAVIGAGGDRSLEPSCRVRLACIALRAGDTNAALSELQAAGRVAQSMHSPRVQVEVVNAYAHLCLQRDRPDLARALLTVAAGHPAATHRQRQLAAAEAAGISPATLADKHPPSAHSVTDLDQALAALLAERV